MEKTVTGSSSPRLVQGVEELAGTAVEVPFPLEVMVVPYHPLLLEVDDLVLLRADVVGNERSGACLVLTLPREGADAVEAVSGAGLALFPDSTAVVGREWSDVC
jgi:hypothetical protein